MTTNKTTGVTTLKQLNKECLKIDLTKVRLKKGYENRPIRFNTDSYGENPHIKFGQGRTRSQWGSLREFFSPEEYGGKPNKTFWKYKTNVNKSGASFIGGRRGRGGIVHANFTNAKIMFDTSTDKILGVRYALDNDYLNEWLRQTIDPSITNNWDELHADKEFEVLITTTTYSQEKVKVVGRTYDECVETLKQRDPELDCEGLYSGMKHTSRGGGTIPSSYEEWVSLQEKEVA